MLHGKKTLHLQKDMWNKDFTANDNIYSDDIFRNVRDCKTLCCLWHVCAIHPGVPSFKVQLHDFGLMN